jgi:hypothetical protein
MTEIIPQSAAWLHIRYEGRSWDLPLADLDLGLLSADDDVRAAVASYLDVPVTKLRLYVVERHTNGNMTVRPEAVFGLFRRRRATAVQPTQPAQLVRRDTSGPERDLRSEMINTILITPHRDLSALHPIHKAMIDQDPIFYVHLAAWYADHGAIRDHKEMFITMLCLSDFEGHRDAGLALLRELPPYEIARVVDFIKGGEVKRRQLKQPRAAGRKAEFETISQHVGLNRNVPRSMRTEIERYLREREADPKRFDRTALTARRSIKRLYAGLHIAPSPRAQAVLFDDDPPEGSPAFQVKQISRASTPAEQARAIAQYRIPYRVASSLIKEMSPMVLAALIDVMTPQEVINNVSSLKKRGAFDNPEIKALIDAKLEAAKTDQRVSAYKAKVAVEAAGADGELAEALEAVTDTQVKAAGKITRPTALLIDKSGSMQPAIEIGRQLGSLASTICEAELFVYAFDTVAYSIKSQGSALTDWEKALAGIKAGGGTSCGVALDQMRRKRQRVEQIVMVTDEDENTAPLFRDVYRDYAEELKTRPAVILVKIGNTHRNIEAACAELGVTPNVFEFRGDYYALPNVIPLLTYPSLMEMVMEVLDYPLPKRKLA